MDLNLFHKFKKQHQNEVEPAFILPGGLVKENKRMTVTLLAALIIVTGLAGYFWYQGRNSNNISQIHDKNLNEAQKLVAEISKLLILPTDEGPTVATVTDLNALKGQPFFVHAKIGDKVLIYSKAKKAILYNPVAKKIVEVAPINLGDQSPLSP